MTADPHPQKIGRTVAEFTPHWPAPPVPPAPPGVPGAAPNVLVVRFDDVGFFGFGCRANFDAGYHLSVDLVDESIRMLADHQAPAGISENTIVLVLSDR